jgi:hypothetical protein
LNLVFTRENIGTDETEHYWSWTNCVGRILELAKKRQACTRERWEGEGIFYSLLLLYALSMEMEGEKWSRKNGVGGNSKRTTTDSLTPIPIVPFLAGSGEREKVEGLRKRKRIWKENLEKEL